HTGLIVTLAIWIPAVSLGVRELARYEYTPGTAAAPPLVWPVSAPVRRSDGVAQLLLFLHAQCPCSRATVRELARLMARRKVAATVIVYHPPIAPGAGAGNDLAQAAREIPGVRLIDDPQAHVAQLFGAATSGQVLLYDAQGRLQFAGGITAARGHDGDNGGIDALVAILSGQPISRPTFPVFGCSLRGIP